MGDRIEDLSSLLQFIRSDIRARGKNRISAAFLIDPICRFTILMRINEYLLNVRTPKMIRALPLICYRRLSIRLGFSIPLNVFGPGVAIVHYGLIVINPAARIGANCRIHAGVNIGGYRGTKETNDVEVSSAPHIGDNVYLGPGAKLYGGIKIGNNCAIGANAVVNSSFPEEGLTIAGIPARVVNARYPPPDVEATP